MQPTLHELKKELKKFFGNYYREAYCQQRRIVLLNGWLQYFRTQRDNIIKKYRTNSLEKTLNIKHLLLDLKDQFYLAIYQETANSTLIDDHLLKKIQETRKTNFCSPQNILIKLHSSVAGLTTIINQEEAVLKNYTWLQTLIASCIRLWTQNPYYRFSKSYFSLFKKRTTDSINKTSLSPWTITLFSNIGSGIKIIIDRYFIGTRAISFAMFNSWGKLFLKDIESLFVYGKKLGLSDETIINNLPKLQWTSGIGIYFVIAYITNNYSRSTFSVFLLNYLVASTSGSLSGYIFDWVKSYFVNPDNKSRSTIWNNPYIKPFIQLSTSLLGQKYITPIVYKGIFSFFKPKPTVTQMLSDEATCLEHKEECNAAIRKVFGVSEKATSEEIHAAFHKLALLHHPDKGSTSCEIVELLQAKQRFDDLQHSDRLSLKN